HLRDPVDDRLRPDLVERDPLELGGVESPNHGALFEQGLGERSAVGRLGQEEVVPAHVLGSTRDDRTYVRSGATGYHGPPWGFGRGCGRRRTAAGRPRPTTKRSGGPAAARRSAAQTC